jgi:hypothetical protein
VEETIGECWCRDMVGGEDGSIRGEGVEMEGRVRTDPGGRGRDRKGDTKD